MRKRKVITIDIDEKTKKDFAVKELTLQQIIDLSQKNPLFAADTSGNTELAGNHTGNDPEQHKKSESLPKGINPNAEKGLLEQLSGDFVDFSKAAKEVVGLSCDFQMEDLLELAPSDIKQVFDGWKEVNQTFLHFLEKMGILEAVMAIIKGAISDFSEMLAI